MFSSGLLNNPIAPPVVAKRINHTSSTLGSEYIIADKAILPANPSDMFCICMRRHSSDAADTYKTNKGWVTIAANFCLISMDLHFRGNRFGTITQYK